MGMAHLEIWPIAGFIAAETGDVVSWERICLPTYRVFSRNVGGCDQRWGVPLRTCEPSGWCADQIC